MAKGACRGWPAARFGETLSYPKRFLLLVEAGDDCTSCPGDCGACLPSCGNGTCESGEDCASCPGDGGACPVCRDVDKDGPALDPSCDPCADFVCNVFGDSFCCTDLWDKTCIFEAAYYCATCM